MARWRGPVLLDTNAVIEAWRVDAWRALCGGYLLETVEECVSETHTGFQRRRPEKQVDPKVLLAGLKAVHQVNDAERAAALIREVKARRRSGRMRLPARMFGFCAGRIRRVYASASGSSCATVSSRSSAFSRMRDFGRRHHSETPIVRMA